MIVIKEQVDMANALERGLAYLAAHQFPNGEFCTYCAGDVQMKGWIRPDNSIFSTTLISGCLIHLRDKKMVSTILSQSLQYLGGQMGHGGVWNHFAKYHYLRDLCPYDLDDTSCASALYRDMGINWPQPSNKSLLLSNRTNAGLFYTWFVPRFKPILNRTYWRLTLSEFIRPIHTFFFWRNVEAKRNDVDAVVNANVLYYLGNIPQTKPIINYLNRIILEQREADCDKWYRDPFIVYYFFSRNYFAGIKELEPIREPIINRILGKAKPDGCIGETITDTAWAVCSLLNLGYFSHEMERAVKYLVRNQAATGEWPRWVVYYGGPKKLVGWGSEEITTAYCLEAIARYYDFIIN